MHIDVDDARGPVGSLSASRTRVPARIAAVTPRRARPIAGTLGQILVLLGAVAATEASIGGLSPAPALVTFFVGAAMMGLARRTQRAAVSSPTRARSE